MRSPQQSAEVSDEAASPAVWSELTPRDAAMHLAHLRRWARGLNIAMLVVIALGAYVLPASTALSILLALIPWAAITLVGHR